MIKTILLCALTAFVCSCSSVQQRDSEVRVKEPHDPAVTAVITEKYDSIGGGMLGYSFTREKERSRFVKDGVYLFPHGKTTIRIPHLTTGQVSVNQSENRSRGVLDHQVRFFEGNNDALAPWPLKQKWWHAVVVTTQLPPNLKGNPGECTKAAEFCALEVVKKLARGQYEVSRRDWHGMTCFQLSVPGRIPSKIYPQSAVSLAPGKWRDEYFGVNRFVISSSQIVEVGMVVSRSSGVTEDEFAAFAQDALDSFMDGLTIEK